MGAQATQGYGATAAPRPPGTSGASCASVRGLWVRCGGSVKGAGARRRRARGTQEPAPRPGRRGSHGSSASPWPAGALALDGVLKPCRSNAPVIGSGVVNVMLRAIARYPATSRGISSPAGLEGVLQGSGKSNFQWLSSDRFTGICGCNSTAHFKILSVRRRTAAAARLGLPEKRSENDLEQRRR